jgi:hypothetical protein
MPSGYVKLASGSQPIIQPRHSVPRFKLNQSVFIGNTVKYASDALASPKNNISNYVQGELKDLVKYVFSDKKSPTRIRVASGQGSGGRNLFNLFSPGTKYVSYEVPGEST